MLTTIEGLYRKGSIELIETPQGVPDGARVLVTFIAPPTGVELQARGVSVEQAAQLRDRFATFAEDWESPEMNAYDNYDTSRR